MNMVGDLGRYAQFEAAQAIPIAAANEGGAAGVGVGLGAGISMAQTMMNAMKPAAQPGGAPGIGRDEVLRGMRTRHSEDRQVLCGVRQGSAMMGRR